MDLIVAGDARNWEISMSGKSELRMGLVAGTTSPGVVEMAEMAEELGTPNPQVYLQILSGAKCEVFRTT